MNWCNKFKIHSEQRVGVYSLLDRTTTTNNYVAAMKFITKDPSRKLQALKIL